MNVYLKYARLLILGICFLSANATGNAADNDFKTGPRIDSLIPANGQTNGVIRYSKRAVRYTGKEIELPAKQYGSWNFKTTEFGGLPNGWEDLLYRRPSRNWVVDENGFLRHILKNRSNKLTYDPFTDSFKESPTTQTRPGMLVVNDNNVPGDIRIRARFKKTEDEHVFFGVTGRIQNQQNFYTVMLTDDDRLLIAKMKGDSLLPLSELAILNRYSYPGEWELVVSFYNDLITGMLYDSKGQLQGRLDARDGEFETGTCGIYATDYVGVSSYNIWNVSEKTVGKPFNTSVSHGNKDLYGYRLLKPDPNPETLNIPFENLDVSYDIIVAGAGTSGWAAAVQAARMGRKVLLLEETDWIGGQMTAAAVASMDESGPLIRERGIYREFHESIVSYYYAKEKSPFMAYFWGRNTQNQQEGGYEPLVARNLLYAFIREAKNTPGAKLDVLLRTRVTKVQKKGNRITGITASQWNESGVKSKTISCKVLIDATEYGDVIPLTGATYRVGNTKSSEKNWKGVVQDHTFTAVIREYPNGIPEYLKIKQPPPKYEEYRKKFMGRTINGDWGLHNGARMYRAELAWRGMADSHSPMTGKRSQLRHTLTGLNGGNDYPVSVATIESDSQRLVDESDGIYRTLAKIYYLQNELNLPWSVAEDQQFNTSYNREMMKRRGIPDSLIEIAKHMPQIPYVRESRRIEGVKIVVSDDLTRWEKAKHVPTSVAVGDYFMDLHRTYEAIEHDLDNENYARNGGPFQLPMSAFIPRSIDGFIPAEKNFSQSRLVSGATRLQPITMLTGEAVGTMAALAVEKNIQPRALNPLSVQWKLLEQGSTLVPRWYNDIVWGTELWRATQFLSLYKIMDKPGELEYWDGMEFASKSSWGTALSLHADEAAIAFSQLASLFGWKANSRSYQHTEINSVKELENIAKSIHPSLAKMLLNTTIGQDEKITHSRFALICLDLIKMKQ